MTTGPWSPWIQPPDRWGPDVPTGRGVRTSKTITGDPDGGTVDDVAIDFPDAQLSRDGRGGSPVSQSIIELNPNINPATSMPPVSPTGPPPGATGSEFESPSGTLVGDLQVASWNYYIFEQVAPQISAYYNDAGWLAQLPNVSAQLRQVPFADLTLGGDSRYHAAGNWVPAATRAGYGLLWSAGVPLAPTSDNYNSGHITGPAFTLAAATLAGGRAFLLSAVEMSGATNFTGVFSNGGSPANGLQNVSLILQHDFGVGLSFRAFYRPPRYRWLLSDQMDAGPGSYQVAFE